MAGLDHHLVERLLDRGAIVAAGVRTSEDQLFVGYVKATTPENLTLHDPDAPTADIVPWGNIRVSRFEVVQNQIQD